MGTLKYMQPLFYCMQPPVQYSPSPGQHPYPTPQPGSDERKIGLILMALGMLIVVVGIVLNLMFILRGTSLLPLFIAMIIVGSIIAAAGGRKMARGIYQRQLSQMYAARCPGCGAAVPPGCRFCPMCGSRIF